MKSATTPLINLLATGSFVYANLFKITLRSGTVVLWTDADAPIQNGADTYLSGPDIASSAISEQVGLAATSLAINLITDSLDLISGQPIIPYICGGGFYGATVTLTRAYAPNFAAMYSTGPTGAIVRFAGRMGEITSAGGTQIQFNVDSWTILLDANMPKNVCQQACMHTLYDSGCTLSKATFAVSGAVSGTPSPSSFQTGLTQADDYFSLGMVLFTSGPNNGQLRTVRSYAHTSGVVNVVLPFPFAPVAGNTFTIYPGCDLSQATCTTKFSNLAHYKATPFIPAVETAI
jgi:uncharacterized phage protein (TIGR02218 family)